MIRAEAHIFAAWLFGTDGYFEERKFPPRHEALVFAEDEADLASGPVRAYAAGLLLSATTVIAVTPKGSTQLPCRPRMGRLDRA